MGTDLIPLCQQCRRPLIVSEQLVMWDDGLSWDVMVESCLFCGESRTRDRIDLEAREAWARRSVALRREVNAHQR
jgi:RNase P subunit RPR2